MDALERGCAAWERRAWGEAYAALREADAAGSLDAPDLERFAYACYLTGRDADYHATLERAHHGHLEAGDVEAAARCAFWNGLMLAQRGEVAKGSGWIGRAGRLVEDRPDSVLHGYLVAPRALGALSEGDFDEARQLFARGVEIAMRADDPDLAALSRLGLGQALVPQGEVEDGLAILDEAMVSVQANEVSPIAAGIVYCGVLEVCQSIGDLRRAREWTAAFTAWCERQPDLAAFRGRCLVHRSEVLALTGRWSDALDEARSAVERLSAPPEHPSVGAALYQQAELHRVRGELAEAEEAYRQANRRGHPPQPGMALLRLVQGELDAAAAAIARELGEPHPPAARARLLAAQAEIALAADDLATARRAADELREIADRLDVPATGAVAAHVHGAVLLVEGDARAALGVLRQAWNVWHDFDAPYEAARVRVLLGLACRELGDTDGAQLEFEAAREQFRGLGAVAALERLEQQRREPAEATAGGLTDREVEVLRLVARGDTNRAIAAELVISEHTVARHVQNIFTKLGVTSRTAAAAFAFEHGLA